jgi:hypothetical protein
MDRSRSIHEKLAKSVDTTRLKHASKSQKSLEGIEARAAARAEDFRGGTGALVTRSVRKQLDQGVNLYGIASFAEKGNFPLNLEQEGNPSLAAMPLPRTPQPQKKTAPTPIQSGHRTKKQRKADEAEEADELAKERRKQGNVSPDLSELFSDNATCQTLAGVVRGGEEEREADQTKFLNPPGRTAPPTPTTDPPDVTTPDPTTTAEGLLGEES